MIPPKNKPHLQNCKGELIDLTTPKVMGILNITPDSFYDGGCFKDSKSVLDQVEKMLEGATFDLVATFQTGVDFVSVDEELKRIVGSGLNFKSLSRLYNLHR